MARTFTLYLINFDSGTIISGEQQGAMSIANARLYKGLKNNNVRGCFSKHNTKLNKRQHLYFQLRHLKGCSRTDSIHVGNFIDDDGKVTMDLLAGNNKPCRCTDDNIQTWQNKVERIIHDAEEVTENGWEEKIPIGGVIGLAARPIDGGVDPQMIDGKLETVDVGLGAVGSLDFNHYKEDRVSDKRIRFVGDAELQFQCSIELGHIVVESILKDDKLTAPLLRLKGEHVNFAVNDQETKEGPTGDCCRINVVGASAKSIWRRNHGLHGCDHDGGRRERSRQHQGQDLDIDPFGNKNCLHSRRKREESLTRSTLVCFFDNIHGLEAQQR